MKIYDDPSMLTRREMLKNVSASALTAFLPGVHRRKLKVIVIGAGMAGLCSAYELQNMGHDVVLLEAELQHAGGRVRTARFKDGLFGELGAMRIPASHTLTHHYVRKFNLSLRPFVEYNPKAYYYVNGQRRRNGEVRRLDTQFTSHMDGRSGGVWSEKFTEIVGGMDLLAQRFVSKLAGPPRFGHVVTHIIQSEDGNSNKVVVKTDVRTVDVHKSGKAIFTADAVICTVPLPVIKKIQFSPNLPSDLQRAIAGLPYSAAHKVLAVTSTRFWEQRDGIFGGGTYTDLPIGMVYYPADNAVLHDPKVTNGPGVLLASYTIRKKAEKLARHTPEAAAAIVATSIASIHPEVKNPGVVRQTMSWSWGNHLFAGGAFAESGVRNDLTSALSKPFGRVFFAGEHISGRRSWIQGALESATRTVREINQLS